MRILKICDVHLPRVNGASTAIRAFADELQHGDFMLLTARYADQ